MEIANCEVRLCGDVGNSVFKQGVTPAEVVVLKTLHGDESVCKIKLVGSDRRSHREEHERLSKNYGEAMTPDGQPIFFKIFPASYDPRLPVSFKDIGVTFSTDSENPAPSIPDVPDMADGASEWTESSEAKPVVEDIFAEEPVKKKK